LVFGYFSFNPTCFLSKKEIPINKKLAVKPTFLKKETFFSFYFLRRKEVSDIKNLW
jgi:hypothetical protein